MQKAIWIIWGIIAIVFIMKISQDDRPLQTSNTDNKYYSLVLDLFLDGQYESVIGFSERVFKDEVIEDELELKKVKLMYGESKDQHTRDDKKPFLVMAKDMANAGAPDISEEMLKRYLKRTPEDQEALQLLEEIKGQIK